MGETRCAAKTSAMRFRPNGVTGPILPMTALPLTAEPGTAAVSREPSHPKRATLSASFASSSTLPAPPSISISIALESVAVL